MIKIRKKKAERIPGNSQKDVSIMKIGERMAMSNITSLWSGMI
jgi:hypothetical protein